MAGLIETKPEENGTWLQSTVSPIVGRAAELTALAQLLDDPACRLVTLVGPGGIGKTRLAIEAANRAAFEDGVDFVSLQCVNDVQSVRPAIAEAIGLKVFQGSDPLPQVLNHLRDRALLLVIDNFDHVLDSASVLSQILDAAPGVKILVTSRETLDLREEYLYPVQGLSYPSLNALPGFRERQPEATTEQILDHFSEQYSAVQLFVQSARRNRASFSAVDELAGICRLCALVEGMPLAIELAAAWVRTLSCDAIADEIRRGLDILETTSRNMISRHRSMRAVLQQTWNQLTPEEQAVFARLSAFRGGFTRAAASIVAGASLRALSTLVDKSLLRHNPQSPPDGRYELHELISQFAAEKLAAATGDDERLTLGRHGRYFSEWLAELWKTLRGPGPAMGRSGGEAGLDQKGALLAIDREIDNIRAAWKRAVMLRDENAIELALHSLWFYYDTRSLYAEGESAFAQAAAALGGNGVCAGRLYARQASMSYSLSTYDRADRLYMESLQILSREPDTSQVDIAFTLHKWGELKLRLSRYAESKTLFERSLALYRSQYEEWGIAMVLNWLALMTGTEKTFDSEAGRQLALESLQINRVNNNLWGIADTLHRLAHIEWHNGNYARAGQYARECLAICQDINLQWGRPMALKEIAAAELKLGNIHEGERAIYQGLAPAHQFRIPAMVAECLVTVAQLKAYQGDMISAAELLHMTLIYPDRVWRDEVDEMLEVFAQKMDGADYRAAALRGKTMDFEAVTQTLLHEYEHADLALPASVDVLPQADPITGHVDHGAQSRTSIERDNTPSGRLTTREAEVLSLIAEGLSNREIAERLVFSVGTVKWYANQIFSKLSVGSRTQAIVRARELGLLEQASANHQ